MASRFDFEAFLDTLKSIEFSTKSSQNSYEASLKGLKDAWYGVSAKYYL